MKQRGRKLQSVTGIALHVHRILRESGARKLTVLRGLVRLDAGRLKLRRDPKSLQALFERVIGILFLRGIVEWEGARNTRRLVARTANG